MGVDNDRILEALGAEIRAEAAASRISLNALAESAGIVRTTLYKYLDNDRAMPIAVLLAVADRLDVRPDVLMDRAQQRAGRDPQGGGDSNQI